MRIAVFTTGADRDSSYLVRVGEGQTRLVRVFLNLSLPDGEHDVVLGDVASNCAVQGADSIRVSITSGSFVTAEFRIECRAISGAIQVNAQTSGRDFDPDGYTVYLDGASQTQLFPFGAVVLRTCRQGVTRSGWAGSATTAG